MRSSMHVSKDGQAETGTGKVDAATLKLRAKNAQDVAKNASLKSVSDNDKNSADSERTISDSFFVKTPNKFGKDSKERKVYSLNLNLYQKAALFIVAKSESCKMKEALNRFSLSQIMKKAESLGLNENLVEELFNNKLIK